MHNGIIENFRELRGELQAKGHEFSTETDSEVIAHLVSEAMRGGLAPAEAVASSLPRLRGAFALALIFDGEEDLLIGASNGAPLAVGFGEGDHAGEMFLGSDALALVPFTGTIAYLEDGDSVVLTRASARFYDAEGKLAERRRVKSAASASLIGKGNYRHFMAKEIHEQPEVVARTLGHYLDMPAGRVALPFALPVDIVALQRLTICGCGTAYFAGLTAKYWFERFARLPVDVEIASEFRYRDPPLPPGGLTILVSQSGETADTLACLRAAKAKGQTVVSVVNEATSTMARASDVVAPTLAGPEIGVASTKAFTCQLAVLACLALAFGRARNTIDEKEEARLVAELMAVPGLIAQALKCESAVETLAREIAKVRDVLYLGRGTSYPLALEGALKLKEISYIHAEGYAAGELKHGPIALVDQDMPVIVIAPNDPVLEKTLSNMQEVAARGGRLILIGDARLARDFGYRGSRRHRDAGCRAGVRGDGLCGPGPIDRLSYRRRNGEGRRPAAQSRQKRHGGIGRTALAKDKRNATAVAIESKLTRQAVPSPCNKASAATGRNWRAKSASQAARPAPWPRRRRVRGQALSSGLARSQTKH